MATTDTPPRGTPAEARLRPRKRWPLAQLLMAAGLLAPLPARADNATVKLIQLLIKKGILTQGQAGDLLDQAQAEAAAVPLHPHTARPHGRAASAAAEPVAEPPPDAPSGTPPGNEVRVTYVPQFVRDQIASEVRSQVMTQAKNEGWARPDTLPSWIQRIEMYGDLRLRYQGNYEDPTNAGATGQPFFFPDFNTINSGSGFNTNDPSSLPTLNVLENRERFRVRARLGLRAQVSDWVSADVRLATGNDNSPVSENQTQGRPGDFAKYAVYVDRAYLQLQPVPSLKVYAGREPNPYFVSDLMYAPDLNFDGVSVQYQPRLSRDVGVFFNAGAYPVFNTDLNFSSTSLVKGSSRDAYLLAAQAGGTWTIAPHYDTKIGVGYFAYSNVTGKESAPCLLLTTSDTCSTDDSRPSFLQFGNTLFPIRNLVTNASAIPALPQYYGLASHFGVLDAHGRLDISPYDPIVVSLEGEFVKNLAFDRHYILARAPVNNYGSVPPGNPSALGPNQGGDTGYMAKVTVGYPQIDQLWDWNVSLAYKYLESDSVLDALTDPDFHLGGTNAKGYVLGGNLGISRNTYLSVRWLSANEVSGPTYRNDVLQIDLNAKF